MLSNDLRTILLNAWMVVSVGIVLILMAPFVLPAETVLRLTPTCLWKSLFGVECPSCGMTRSFVLLSEGAFAEAAALNRLSLWLYGACVLNTIVLAILSARLLTRWALGSGPRLDWLWPRLARVRTGG